MKDLINFVNENICKYPIHATEIMDLYKLCLDEISNGESESNEIELCYSSIKDIIN